MTEHTLLQQMNDFCRLLRQMDVNVTTTNQLGWCRSVQLINISERETFYHTARTNLIANRADRETFDMAFNLFWRYPRPEFQVADTGSEESESSALQDLYDANDEENVIEQWLDYEEADDEEGQEDDPIAYSVDDVLTRKDFSTFTKEDMERAQEVVAKLAAVLATRLSRRKVISKKGRTIDFRRSWRRSLAYGGEPIELMRKQQKIKKTKILLLCDVSGSMDCYAKFLIQFIYGMQQEL